MRNKIAFAAVGILLTVTPVIVAAQTLGGLSDTCSTSPTVQCLQQEILQLIQILEQLLAGRNNHQSTTIDQSSLSQSQGTFAVTGSTSAGNLFVVLVGPGYNGPTDYASVSGLLKGGSQFSSVGNTATVSGGHYSAQFNGVPMGQSYQVYVYDGDAAPQWNLVVSGTLTVAPAIGTKGGNTFTISVNGKAFGPTTYAAGTSGDLVGQFALDATQSSQDIRVTMLDLEYFGNVATNPTSCALFNGTTQLSSGGNLVNPNTSGGNPTLYNFNFDNPLVVPEGQAVIVNVECNIPSSATSGSFSFGLNSGDFSSVFVGASNEEIAPTVVSNAGYTMTVGSNGSLVASNPTPAPSSIVAGGTTGVTVGAFTLQPTGESMNLQQIGLDLSAGQAYPGDIVRAYVYQGPELVGQAVFTGNAMQNCPPAFTGTIAGGCYYATTTVSLSHGYGVGGQYPFTIKADVSNIGTAQPGRSGDYLVVGLSDAQATGANSGSTYNSGSAPTQVGVRIFKSYPSVALDPLNSTNVDFSAGKQPALLRFKVTANASGSIGLGVIPVQISETGVTFQSFSAYGFTDSSYQTPIPGMTEGAQTFVNTSLVNSGTFSVPINAAPIEIPAGQTYYFQLVGNSPTVTATPSVTALLKADSSYLPIGSQAGNINGPNANFMWSPNDNTTSQFTDNDWTNGFGIPGLSAGSILQVRTGSGAPSPSPLALFAFPTSGTAPANITFTTQGGTPSDTITFGDGASATRWSADAEANTLFLQHTYTAAGTYTVVVNSNGSTATTSVSITGASTPTPVQGGTQIFSTPGTYTFTVPAGVTSFSVQVEGAGGGGDTNSCTTANVGGKSSFNGTLVARGGGGGIGCSDSGRGCSTLASGGSASGGDVNTSGNTSEPSACGGGNGAAPLGGAGGGQGIFSAGLSGGFPGGGGGRANFGAGAAGEGGAGGAYAAKTFTGVTPGTQYTVVVGAGGPGASDGSGPGGTGGNGEVIISWTGTQTAAAQSSNQLANALTALSSALQALLGGFR